MQLLTKISSSPRVSSTSLVVLNKIIVFYRLNPKISLSALSRATGERLKQAPDLHSAAIFELRGCASRKVGPGFLSRWVVTADRLHSHVDRTMNRLSLHINFLFACVTYIIKL